MDALAARIEEIDELGAWDDATYGNDQWGHGSVLKQLIKSADVEGVRAHGIYTSADAVITLNPVDMSAVVIERDHD